MPEFSSQYGVLDRYIGLAIRLLLIIVGLTGSLLVFQHEIDHTLAAYQSECGLPESRGLAH